MLDRPDSMTYGISVSTIREWEPEEVPVGCQIRRKDDHKKCRIIHKVSSSKYPVKVGDFETTLENLCANYEWAEPGPTNEVEWKPCGVKEMKRDEHSKF